MEEKPLWLYSQSGIIPFRQRGKSIEILLITTIKRKRWIIPKGVIDPGMTPQEAAVQEAFEEAGIKGSISPGEIGEYQYKKWGGVCNVKVFLFEVREILNNWPESDMRDRKWMTINDAAETIKEDELKKIIKKLPELIQ